MQIRVKKQNIDEIELAKALAGYIQQEGLAHDVMDKLSKSEHKEPIPERYIRYIVDKMQKEFRSLMTLLNRNVDTWLADKAKIPKRKLLRKAEIPPPVLTQEQIDELRILIESHFRHVIGIHYNVPPDVQKQWTKIGIQSPKEDLEKWIQQAYVSGRLADVLDNHSTYAEMLREAKKLTMSRPDRLVLAAAKMNAARFIKGYGVKLADIAEDVMLEHHKSSIQTVVQHYFSGEFTQTKYNEAGFTPAEVNKLLSTEKPVQGWQELSTELKNRFKAVDVGRDWDRVAVTETRYATNMGRIMNIQVEGGGDPEEIEVYYHVQSTACKHCKKLYLEPDETPKIFKLSEILANVQETGGMNVGLKASLIGEKGGYLPNASTHPWCQCFPLRVIPGYPMVYPGKDRRDENDREKT